MQTSQVAFKNNRQKESSSRTHSIHPVGGRFNGANIHSPCTHIQGKFSELKGRRRIVYFPNVPLKTHLFMVLL